MNMMATRRRRKTLFSLEPRVLILQRHLLAGISAAFAVTLLFIVIVVLILSAPPSSPPSRYDIVHDARSSSMTSRDDPPPRCGATTTTTTGLGEFGEMMLSMLPKDLAFTVFVPSPDSFRRVLKLPPDNASDVSEGEAAAAGGTTYAVVSRVLGFSAVPRRLRSADVPLRDRPVRRPLDSVSGLRIYAWRDVDGVLVANGVRSECVDIVRGETVVHVMAGVLMDAEFERSFPPEFED